MIKSFSEQCQEEKEKNTTQMEFEHLKSRK